jgi:hypothetical protein
VQTANTTTFLTLAMIIRWEDDEVWPQQPSLDPSAKVSKSFCEFWHLVHQIIF